MLEMDKLRDRFEARIAELVDQAKEIDAELRETPNPDYEENAVEMEDDEVLEGLGNVALDEIRQLNLDQMTPLAALQELNRLRDELQRESEPE